MTELDSNASFATGSLLTLLATHLRDGLLTIDETEKISFANESASAITGYAVDEIVGQRVPDLLPPSLRTGEQNDCVTDALRSRETVTYQSQSRDKEIDVTIIRTDLFADTHLPASAIVLLRDVSANTSHEDNPQTARMRFLGQLTMGIAHDFNNALTSIICNTQLVGEIFERLADRREQTGASVAPEQTRAPKYLDDITRVSRKAADFIRALLAYARQQQLARETIDLNAAVTDTIYLTRKLLGEGIIANFQPEPNLSIIYAERSQIDQVLWNLLVNARDAMPHGGHLLVETVEKRIGIGARPAICAI